MTAPPCRPRGGGGGGWHVAAGAAVGSAQHFQMTLSCLVIQTGLQHLPSNLGQGNLHACAVKCMNAEVVTVHPDLDHHPDRSVFPA